MNVNMDKAIPYSLIGLLALPVSWVYGETEKIKNKLHSQEVQIEVLKTQIQADLSAAREHRSRIEATLQVQVQAQQVQQDNFLREIRRIMAAHPSSAGRGD